MPAIARARLLANREVAPGHYRMDLACPAVTEGALAGQFCNLLMPGWPLTVDPLLPRPMSYHSLDHAAGRFAVLFQVVGRGTALLSRLEPGDGVHVVGPLGRPFPLAAPDPWVLVGGGVGVAPLLALAQAGRARGASLEVLVGAQSAPRLLAVDGFRALDLEPRLATDDGSAGFAGFVTDLLARRLADGARYRTVFACGPVPMLRRVQALATDHRLSAYLSLEALMACGVGACMACVRPVRRDGEAAGYLRLCVDGPVVAAGEVVFD